MQFPATQHSATLHNRGCQKSGAHVGLHVHHDSGRDNGAHVDGRVEPEKRSDEPKGLGRPGAKEAAKRSVAHRSDRSSPGRDTAKLAFNQHLACAVLRLTHQLKKRGMSFASAGLFSSNCTVRGGAGAAVGCAGLCRLVMCGRAGRPPSAGGAVRSGSATRWQLPFTQPVCFSLVKLEPFQPLAKGSTLSTGTV